MKNKKTYFLITVTAVIIQTLIYQLGKIFATNNLNLIHSQLDDKIPFLSIFVIFYIVWYFMLILVPLTIAKHDNENFNKYILCILINALLCAVIFIIYPSEIIRNEITNNTIFDKLVSLIYKFDNPTVCLPSMHAAASFIFCYFSLTKQIPKSKKITIIVLSILVILSTLFIKQHVLYDVLGALIVSLIAYILSSIINKKYKKV